MKVSSRRSSTSAAPGVAVASAMACSSAGVVAMSSSPAGAMRVDVPFWTTSMPKEGIDMDGGL